MSVSVDKQGGNYSVTATFAKASVPGKQGDYLPDQWMARVIGRAMDELANAQTAATVSDADLDAEYAKRAADLDAEKAARKAARATGNL